MRLENCKSGFNLIQVKLNANVDFLSIFKDVQYYMTINIKTEVMTAFCSSVMTSKFKFSPLYSEVSINT